MKKFWQTFKNLRLWRVLGGSFRRFFGFLGRHLKVTLLISACLVLLVGGAIALGLTLPVKSVEVEGEVILLEGEAYSGGLNIKATTKAGLIHREEVVPKMISGLDPSVPGEQTATVSYKKWRIPVTVKVLALSEITLRVREGTMPDVFEPNDAFPTSGVFDLYYNDELIRSAPITRDQVPGFTTRLSNSYDTSLVYRKGLSLPYHYTVLEVIDTITPTGVLYAPQGVALSKGNALGNMRFLVKYKDGTEEYVMIYDDRIFVQENVLSSRDVDYQDEMTFTYKGVEIVCPVTAYHGELLAPKSVTLHVGKSVYVAGETFDYASAYLEVVYERFGDAPVLLRATQDMIFLAEWQGDAENAHAAPVTDGSEPIVFDTVKYYTVLAYYNLAYTPPLSVRVISEEDAGHVTDLFTTWTGRASGPPAKGQDLEFTNATVKAEYGFGYRYETNPLTADMVAGYDKSVAGDQTLTITYQEGDGAPFYKEIHVRVGDPASSEVTALIGIVRWDEPTYYSSDELVVPETAYLEVEIGYGGRENGKVYLKDNPDVTITGFAPHTVEEQTLTVSYKGFSVTQRFIVMDDRTKEIVDFWAPKDIYFDVGKDTELDLSGRCTVFYSTGSKEYPTLAEVLSMGGKMVPADAGFDSSNLVPGENYAVMFYYPDYNWSDHYTWIHVSGEVPVTAKSLRLDVSEAKSPYGLGDSVDYTHMKLYLVYSDNSETDISDDLNELMFQNFSTQTTGDRTAIVTYMSEKGDLVTEYNYSVVE